VYVSGYFTCVLCHVVLVDIVWYSMVVYFSSLQCIVCNLEMISVSDEMHLRPYGVYDIV
jgi:hypothetical protein